MKSLRTLALGAVLVAGMSAAAAAQTTQPGTEPGRRQGSGELRKQRRHGLARALFRGIDLSETQRQQIRTIQQRYKTEFDALRAQRRQSGQAGERRQRPDSVTLVQIRTLAERRQGEIRAVLTPDQQKTFDQNLAQLQERRKEMRNERRGDRRELRPGLR